MGWLQAVQAYHISFAFGLYREAFVTSLNYLVWPSYGFCSGFHTPSYLTYIHMCVRREIIMDMSLLWRLLANWCGLQLGHGNFELASVICWICEINIRVSIRNHKYGCIRKHILCGKQRTLSSLSLGLKIPIVLQYVHIDS